MTRAIRYAEALAVQGYRAGFASRGVANVIDAWTIWLLGLWALLAAGLRPTTRRTRHRTTGGPRMDRTLAALIFLTENGADTALDTLKNLPTRNLIKLHDAAIVRWPARARRPRASQLHTVTETLALGGALGGLLLGSLLAAPALGITPGVVMSSAGGNWMRSVSGVGIDGGFVGGVRQKVVPGRSALFLLTSDAQLDAVVRAFRDHEFELVATELSENDQKRLRAVFAAKRWRGQGGGRHRRRTSSS